MKFTSHRIGDYCVVSRHSPIRTLPGQVFKIDGRYMAVAGWKNDRVSFITKAGSWLETFDSEIYEFEGPLGPGFQHVNASKAIVVAGGTGIGAALHLLNARHSLLETHLLHFSRGAPCYTALVNELGEVPHVNTLTQWNTTKAGRPMNPLGPLFCRSDWQYDILNTHFFVIGPKSLVDAVREQCKELGVPDENFHLNY